MLKPVFPERCAIFHAIGSAQDVANRLDEASDRPQPDDCSDPEERAGACGQDFRNGLAEDIGNVGRKLGEHRHHRLPAAFRLAEKVRKRRCDNEEREKRQEREVSEVAGMDETVVINADGDALDDLPDVDTVPELLRDVLAESGAHARKPLAPFLWG
jgi:hypothetical protein